MTAPKSNSENSLYLKFCREKKMVYIEATYQDTLEKFIPKICSFLNKPVEFSRFYKKDLVKAFIDEFSWREKMREIWCKFKTPEMHF
jgi:hypothetical protein